MNFKRQSQLVLVFLILIFTSFTISCTEKMSLRTASLIIETVNGTSVPLLVEIAQSSDEQEKGYMGREVIPDGTGMIFVYNSDRQMHFWMKNTPHALSIAFVDSEGVIREIQNMKPFSLDPISSERSVRYALEVPSLWYERMQINIGDRLRSINSEISLSQALLEAL
ncbi:MAG TPA: DUF192 domain-containing protein [Treponemataceae bacterium]|nr:DUF192 domain-containing protein [Treponemataceae bacterium]